MNGVIRGGRVVVIRLSMRNGGTGSVASSKTIAIETTLRWYGGQPHARTTPISTNSFRGFDCNSQMTARICLPSDLDGDGATAERYAEAQPERKDLKLDFCVLSYAIAWGPMFDTKITWFSSWDHRSWWLRPSSLQVLGAHLTAKGDDSAITQTQEEARILTPQS